MSRLLHEPIPQFTDEDREAVRQLLASRRCCQFTDSRCIYDDCRTVHPIRAQFIQQRNREEGT